MSDKNIVKPIGLANTLGIAPQVVYGWMRTGALPSHDCDCGHKYLLKTEVDAFLAAKAAKKNEKIAVGE
jgi:predicted site-specific integrase-resolvase